MLIWYSFLGLFKWMLVQILALVNGTFTSLSDCILNCATTYIKENELDNINIYPNPSTNLIAIQVGKIQNLSVRILNIIGEEIVIDDLVQFTGNYNKQFGLRKLL